MKVNFNPISYIKSVYYLNRPLKYPKTVKLVNNWKYIDTSLSVMDDLKQFFAKIIKKHKI